MRKGNGMSRVAKKQLLELLDTLQRTNQMIEKTLVSGQHEILFGLLTECQECAITIGNKIEQIYGEGLQCILGLEIYCETIYQIAQSVDDIERCKSLYINSQSQLDVVKTDMEEELTEKKEVVFLPYKACMWDSLESVWKAAKEDEECNVYVIPIPYYDKNPDGTFGELHYEIDQYPKYVPVISYEDYDFETCHPDKIFIHNPYDECNHVTSIHPFFYSKNLKQYTEELIYIPYFVLNEVNPRSREAVRGIEDFVLVPGVINADKVIVQSENMRQAYIEVLINTTGEKTRPIWEKKILGLGSPKYDKVLSMKKEDVEIPKQWLKIIQKSDGSWKKVILYNTSVKALLEHEEQMLKKIKNVFQIFKENKEDVALLWRPHPLIKATICAMRPQLWEEYEKIVIQYQEKGWGIYDDTADLDRAIVISDAYYGDPSSVVQLCRAAGLPVMIQNVYQNL